MDCYATDTPHGKSLLKIVLSLIRFVSPDQISKIKICHMVASEHTEVIEGRRQLIATDVIDPEEAAEYVSIDDDGDYLDEEDESGLGEACSQV